MNKEIKIFNFKENNIREITDMQGNPWFVAKDVCDILEYLNCSKALKDHVDIEDKLNNESLSSLGQRGGWLINESGLYSLMIRSKMKEARKFKKWITSEVLPSIRKTGKYENKTLSPSEEMARGLVAAHQLLEEQKLKTEIAVLKLEKSREKIAEQKPVVNFADKALRDHNKHYSITDAGKHLSIRRSEMFKILRKHKLLTEKNLPMQKALDEGVLTLKSEPDADGHVWPQSVMTMENIMKFNEKYNTFELVPE